VLELRRGGDFAHEVLSEVLERLDVEESMLDASLHELGAAAEGAGEGLSQPGGVCDHLTATMPSPAPANPSCAGCKREGTTPVHLRMCLGCGNVGCCDSSAGRHASRHFKETGHPVMRSIEPGEEWRWCYVDDLLG
jgi:monovalent cation/hydrogen antiporter